MQKRFLLKTLILASMLCLSLVLGVNALSKVQAEGETPITKIAVNGYVEPTSGGTPITAKDLSVDGTEPYTVEDIQWYGLADNGKFPLAGSIWADIYILPKSGYCLPDEKINDITLNGGANNVNSKLSRKSEKDGIKYYLIRTKTVDLEAKVDEITVDNVKAPKIGETTTQWRSELTLGHTSYEIDLIGWAIDNNFSGDYGGFTFEEGHNYAARIVIKLKGGYSLADEVSYKINGQTVDNDIFASIDKMDDGRPILITKQFNLFKEYTVTFPTGAGYTITPEEGSQTTVLTGDEFNFTVKLAGGYHKYADITVKANDEVLTADESGVYSVKEIRSDLRITVEGIHQLTETAKVEKKCDVDGKEAYWHCTTCNEYYSDENGVTKITVPIEEYGVIPQSHNFAWQADDEEHWQECLDCGKKR